MSNQVMHVFHNVSMSNGHSGLDAIAKKNKINIRDLQIGQFVLFINKAFNACKVYASNNVVVHYKHPLGHILNYKALRLIPEFFDGQDIGYSKALKQVIQKEYPHLFEKKEKKELPKRKLQGKNF